LNPNNVLGFPASRSTLFFDKSVEPVFDKLDDLGLEGLARVGVGCVSI